jgi:hypothetical protein
MAVVQPACADRGAGMVLKLSGQTEPPLAPFTELPLGKPFKLDTNTMISVVHYDSCRVVTIVGGEITLTTLGVDSQGGIIKDSQVRTCPKEHLMTQGAAAATSGGMLMRSTDDSLELTTKPNVVFTGALSGDVQEADILRDDRVVAKLKPSDHGITWPSSQAPLAMGTDYTLRLQVAGAPKPITQDFSTVPDSEVDGITIVRVE